MSKQPSPKNFGFTPSVSIMRSRFDLSHGVKTAINAGYLYPFLCQEVLPGDTFSCGTSALARMSTPLYPVMDNLFAETFYFFVPNRLVWENWQKLCGEQESPEDSVDYTVPQITVDGTDNDTNTIYDYFGIPTKVPNLSFNALPLRAYNLIWNEWFRDQNLQEPVKVLKTDYDADEVDNYSILRRGKRHDYFTSCLPWPQKGEAVTLSLGATATIDWGAPVYDYTYGDFVRSSDLDSPMPVYWYRDGSSPTEEYPLQVADSQAGSSTNPRLLAPRIPIDGLPNNWPDMQVDLADAESVTINQLREAIQLQALLERDARGGTRYIELIRSHFGVVSPDARLQRPEYLGGGRSMVNVSPIAQTASADGGVVGSLGAMGTFTMNPRQHGFSKSFVEHGFVIGLVNIRADINYQQGLQRFWSRRTRFDYYWPVLAQLGEQAVLNKEIFAQGASVLNPTDTPIDDEVFGYQERYAEYRYQPSFVTSVMRSNAAQSLDSWHLAQDFDGLPALGDEFIQDNPPIERVVAVTDEPQFICDFYHKFTAVRPMPMFGIPFSFARF